MVLQGGLRPGESVLIHAAGSGVGTAALQIAHVLGAEAIATARTASKLERIRAAVAPWLSAERTLTVAEPPAFAEKVKELTGGRGVKLGLELVGGGYLPETIRAMAKRGRVLLVGLLAGARAEVDLRTVLTQRLQLRGTVLRSRPLEEKIAVALATEAQLLPFFARGQLRPVIDSVMPLSSARDAFERLASNASFGKIVLHG